MNCPNCGAPVVENKFVCSHCGWAKSNPVREDCGGILLALAFLVLPVAGLYATWNTISEQNLRMIGPDKPSPYVMNYWTPWAFFLGSAVLALCGVLLLRSGLRQNILAQIAIILFLILALGGLAVCRAGFFPAR